MRSAKTGTAGQGMFLDGQSLAWGFAPSIHILDGCGPRSIGLHVAPLGRFLSYRSLTGWTRNGSDKPNEYCRNRPAFVAVISSNLIPQLDLLC